VVNATAPCFAIGNDPLHIVPRPVWKNGNKFAPTGIIYANRSIEFIYKKPHMK